MLLPIPLGPNRQTVSPARSSRSKPLSTRRAPVTEADPVEADQARPRRRRHGADGVGHLVAAVEDVAQPLGAGGGLGEHAGQAGQSPHGRVQRGAGN